jgi:hypothetical protein
MSRGQIIAVVSAIVLIVSLFLAWGGVGGDVPEVDLPEGTPGAEGLQDAADDAASITGWESQNTLDIYLAIVGVLVIGNALMMFMGNPDGLPFAPAAAAFLLGVIGTILVAYVIIDLPDGAETKIGLWLALGSIVGLTIGSFLQLRDEAFEEAY